QETIRLYTQKLSTSAKSRWLVVSAYADFLTRIPSCVSSACRKSSGVRYKSATTPARFTTLGLRASGFRSVIRWRYIPELPWFRETPQAPSPQTHGHCQTACTLQRGHSRLPALH